MRDEQSLGPFVFRRNRRVDRYLCLPGLLHRGGFGAVFCRNQQRTVVGVDISIKMIELAIAADKGERLGIEYLVGDARSIHLRGSFDVVLAAYLLNYARSEQDLLAMAKAIHRSVKPGGRFVTVNNNPNQHPRSFGNTRKYGFVKKAGGELRNGTAIHYTFLQDGEDLAATGRRQCNRDIEDRRPQRSRDDWRVYLRHPRAAK